MVELKNTQFPFHVFLKILIAYSIFSRIDQTDLEHLLARVVSFSGFRDFFFVHDLKLPRHEVGYFFNGFE